MSNNDWSDIRGNKKSNNKPVNGKSINSKLDSNNNEKPVTKTQIINKSVSNATNNNSNSIYKLSSLINDGACIRCLNGSCKGCNFSIKFPENLVRFVKNPTNINKFGETLTNANIDFGGYIPRYTTCTFCFIGKCKNSDEGRYKSFEYQSKEIKLCYSNNMNSNPNNNIMVGVHIDISYEEKIRGFDITCEPYIYRPKNNIQKDDDDIVSISSNNSSLSYKTTSSKNSDLKTENKSNFSNKKEIKNLKEVNINKEINKKINEEIDEEIDEDNEDNNEDNIINEYNLLNSNFIELNKTNQKLNDKNNNLIYEINELNDKNKNLIRELEQLKYEYSKIINEKNELSKNNNNLIFEQNEHSNNIKNILHKVEEIKIKDYFDNIVVNQIIRTNFSEYKII